MGTPTYSAVFNRSIAMSHDLDDSAMATMCPHCGVRRALSEASIKQGEFETLYFCPAGCLGPLAWVVDPHKGPKSFGAAAYRVGEWSIGSLTEVEVTIPPKHF